MIAETSKFKIMIVISKLQAFFMDRMGNRGNVLDKLKEPLFTAAAVFSGHRAQANRIAAH